MVHVIRQLFFVFENFDQDFEAKINQFKIEINCVIFFSSLLILSIYLTIDSFPFSFIRFRIKICCFFSFLFVFIIFRLYQKKGIQFWLGVLICNNKNRTMPRKNKLFSLFIFAPNILIINFFLRFLFHHNYSRNLDIRTWNLILWRNFIDK